MSTSIKSLIKANVVNQLSINYTAEHEAILDILIDNYIQIACDNSHRKESDTKLVPYVKNAVIMAYLRIGAESVTSSSEGSQSYSFIDIEEKLAKDTKAIRVLL